MTAPPVRIEYESRLAHWRAACARLERAEDRIGSARVRVFLAGGAAAAWVLHSHPEQIGWLALPVALFVVLVLLHGRTRERLGQGRRGVAHHERNLARLDGRWAGAGPTGAGHAPAHHLFAHDLDLFGEGSLFQLLCTTRTRCGEARLARWLLAPAAVPEIRARQDAVRHLLPDAALRERLALLGDGVAADVDGAALLAWARAEPVRFSPAARGIARILGLLALLAAGVWAFGAEGPLLLARLAALGPLPLVLVGLLETVLALVLKRRMRRVDALTEEGAHALPLLAQLLALLEERSRTPDAPPALASLGAAVVRDGRAASADIARFDALAQSLRAGRLNGFYALFAFLLQLRVHRAHALERWRERVAPVLPAWLEAVGDFEALLALAGHAHENPQDVFPELAEEPLLHAEGLGHPLLPVGRCVQNDLRLDPEHALLLISGSNMSGKSTLLRAAGLAAVLAGAGAPVRARALRIAPFSVGACIAVHDSLAEGASRFWAEITRLRAIDELTRGPGPVLFLLDELLSGTNSHDRLLGARAVLRQLLAHGAVGLVSTHDLALAELADDFAPRAANAHFEDRLVDGRMTFDYRMRPGVVQRGNALALMRSLGLEV